MENWMSFSKFYFSNCLYQCGIWYRGPAVTFQAEEPEYHSLGVQNFICHPRVSNSDIFLQDFNFFLKTQYKIYFPLCTTECWSAKSTLFQEIWVCFFCNYLAKTEKIIWSFNWKRNIYSALNNISVNALHLSYAVYTDGKDPGVIWCCFIKSLMAFLKLLNQQHRWNI